MPYVRNNAQFLSFTVLLTLVNIGLIVGRLYEYRGFKNSDGSVNWCIMIARASGQCQAVGESVQRRFLPLMSTCAIVECCLPSYLIPYTKEYPLIVSSLVRAGTNYK